jgi:hypothetical protein
MSDRDRHSQRLRNNSPDVAPKYPPKRIGTCQTIPSLAGRMLIFATIQAVYALYSTNLKSSLTIFFGQIFSVDATSRISVAFSSEKDTRSQNVGAAQSGSGKFCGAWRPAWIPPTAKSPY